MAAVAVAASFALLGGGEPKALPVSSRLPSRRDCRRVQGLLLDCGCGAAGLLAAAVVNRWRRWRGVERKDCKGQMGMGDSHVCGA